MAPEVKEVKAVFVPSYCLQQNGILLTAMSEEATRRGCDAALAEKANILIFSTAYNTWKKEFALKKSIAVSMGVAGDIITPIGEVISTFDETTKLGRLLEGKLVATVIVVADKWHVPRLKRLLNQRLPGYKIVMYSFSTPRYDTMLEPSFVKRFRSSNGFLWALWNIMLTCAQH